MPNSYEWPSGPALPNLATGEIHLWRATLDLSALELSSLEETLASEERDRAARLRFAVDRRHFIAGRAALRDILARYLRTRPVDLCFSYGPSGKPGLPPRDNQGSLHFNLSHSSGLAVFALTSVGEIGVDLEQIRPYSLHEVLANRFFSGAETSALRNLPDDLRTDGFFNCWTRKEAYVKARGEGLFIPLDSFAVTLDPRMPAKFINGPQGWQLYPFHPAQGFIAAAAVRDSVQRITFWDWNLGTRRRFRLSESRFRRQGE